MARMAILDVLAVPTVPFGTMIRAAGAYQQMFWKKKEGKKTREEWLTFI
jgi:hypothetical protein